MVIGAAFLRVDDPSLLFIAALVILAGGIIAYLSDRGAGRKPDHEREHPRRAA